MKFIIEGQRPLSGELPVYGSKNAILKILAAALLTSDPCRLTNVPRIEDVFRLIEILEPLGAHVEWTSERTLVITAREVHPERLSHESVGKLRASVVLMGALLGRCGQVRMPGPGGDQIGARPLDVHLDAFRQLGYKVQEDRGVYDLRIDRRTNATFTMSEFSVTATENVILASVLATGCTTTVHCAAADPSVQDLCWFLRSLGAKIEGVGQHTIRIDGVGALRASGEYAVMPDPVEAGTFLSLAAAARANIVVRNVPVSHLRMELMKFREANVRWNVLEERRSENGEYDVADLQLQSTSQLHHVRNLHNMPYPGFNPDLLPPFSVMLTQADGTSLVHDWMYEGRLKYVDELNKMGAEIFVSDPHRILITGPRNLYGTAITNYDIRTGASLFIAALVASGTSTLGPVYQLDRGYEQLDLRMRAIGASVKRLDE